MTVIHLSIPGPVLLRGLAYLNDEQEVSEADASRALAACRAAGRRVYAEAVAKDIDWTEATLDGLARMEAEGALADLGLDAEDVAHDLLVALADEFLTAYRAA